MCDVPDQPLNPPEPQGPSYWDYLEATADQYNDEQRERESE